MRESLWEISHRFARVRLDLFRESHKVRNNLYSIYADEITARFSEFYRSFSTVIGAQMTISAINTVLTAIFVLFLGLPYGPVVVGLTFLCGLFPIVGNVVSNTVIVFIGFTVSAKVAFIALIFLIVIHKLEYFLNARIVGSRIHAHAWELLVAMLGMEAAFGLPGVVAAPIYYAYVKAELADRGLV